MMNTDLAWAAGLFDGEGCIYAARGCITLHIGMTDAESLGRFTRIVGGKLYGWRKGCGPKRRPYRDWYAGGKDAIRIIELLSPWLGSVKLADYDFAKRTAPNSGSGSGRAGRDKTHCIRGHAFTADNTYWSRSKYGPTRACRTCQRRWQAEYKVRVAAR